MRYVRNGSGLTQAAANLLYLALSALDTDATMAADSDAKVASQKAIRAYLAAVADGAAGADRMGATPIPALGEQATVQAILERIVVVMSGLIGAANAFVPGGPLDCTADPNYPAADAGFIYYITGAGHIGGASGPAVEVHDLAICWVDSSAAGDHATVGANWTIVNKNIDAATDAVAGIVELLTDAEALAGTDTARAMTAANLKYLIDNNFPGLNRHLRFNLLDPDAVYAIDGEICLIPKTDAAFTITAYDVTCDANPTGEFDCDLYYADDFVTRANAVKLADITTDAGKVSATGQTLAVPAGKALYLVLADPDDAITQVVGDFTYDYDAPA